MVVIYQKMMKKAILKKKMIELFCLQRCTKSKRRFLYDIQINQLYDYNGLKEVKSYIIVNEKTSLKDYKKYFIDATESNILILTTQMKLLQI